MNRTILILIIGIFLCLPVPGHAEPTDEATQEVPVQEANDTQTQVQVDQTNFFKGYELFKDGKYEKACPDLYAYIHAYTPDAPDYEWAEFFLGVSLMKLGYSHAASDILARLVSRKPNPRIVEYSLEIFETMSRTQPFDSELIITQTVCDQEFGYAGGTLSDFINYHQGLYDWEHGFMAWGDEHFARIKPGTYYYYKYLARRPC
jgi:hypothetical protein